MTNAAQAQTRTTWNIDPNHSHIEFSAKHMMFTTVKGRFATVKGVLLADEADLANSTVEVEIEAASLDTHAEQRDAHLRSDEFLSVEQFPQLTFKSTRIEPVGEDKLRVFGDLTIRGVTQEVELDTTINGRGVSPYGQEVVGIAAQTRINRKDFGLTWNVALEQGGVLVSDEVRIAIEFEAIKQS
ncbi:MAG: YceI family protein [Chloroflexia bacterium]